MKQLFSREYTARHLLNPARKYVNAASTSVGDTIKRIQAECQTGQGSAYKREQAMKLISYLLKNRKVGIRLNWKHWNCGY